MHEIEIEVITKRICTLEPYLNWHYLCENSSINYEILSKFTNKEINYYFLSINPNITIKDILNNLDKPWDWSEISANKSITFKEILDNSKLPWNWKTIINSKFESITFEDILNNLDKPWDWCRISSSKSITFKEILDNPNLPWDWKGLFENPNLCAEYFINNPGPWTTSWGNNNNHDFIKSGFLNLDSDSESERSIDTEYYCEYFEYNIIDIEYIHEHYNYEWKDIVWYFISSNEGITLQDYLDNKNKYKWHLEGLSNNPNITIKDVLENPKIEWKSDILIDNQNITIKDILENPQLNWDFSIITHKENITIKDILENPQLKWDMNWDKLSQKLSYATYDILEKCSDKPLNYEYISYNPNITFEYIIKNIDKNWNWRYLSRNPGLFNIKITDPDLLTCAREFFAARKIQRQWHRAIADPTWELCRRRLRREFTDLVS